MKLIVGLGNPGSEYSKTRHNAGFMIADQIQKKWNFEDFKKESKYQAEISVGNLSQVIKKNTKNEEKIIIAKPQTYMNLSGESVSKIVTFYKLHPEDIIVIYDDLDLQLGQIRIRLKGSAGTHNGMKSIVANLGNNNFTRLRIGIESRGLSAPKQMDTTSFVIGPFLEAEKDTLKESQENAINALEIMLESGAEKAMNQYN